MMKNNRFAVVTNLSDVNYALIGGVITEIKNLTFLSDGNVGYYECTNNGVSLILNIDTKFYASLNDFEKNVVLSKSNADVYDMIRTSIPYCWRSNIAINDGEITLNAYWVENGELKYGDILDKIEVHMFRTMTKYDMYEDTTVIDKYKYFVNADMASNFLSYTERKDDGTEVQHKSIYDRFKLTDEQKSIVEQIKALFEKAKEMDILTIRDYDYDCYYFVNDKDDVCTLITDDCDFRNGDYNEDDYKTITEVVTEYAESYTIDSEYLGYEYNIHTKK